MNTALRSRRPNGGFTLLEMLVYVAIFGLTLNILASLLMTGARLSATAALSLDRLAGVRDVQEAFTTYTRRAAGVAASVEATRPARTPVLAMPPGWGYDYAVLGKLGEDGGDHFGVLRLRNGDSRLESDFLQFRAQPLAHLRFEVDESGARPVVHMEIQVKPESESAIAASGCITAATRGDDAMRLQRSRKARSQRGSAMIFALVVLFVLSLGTAVLAANPHQSRGRTPRLAPGTGAPDGSGHRPRLALCGTVARRNGPGLRSARRGRVHGPDYTGDTPGAFR